MSTITILNTAANLLSKTLISAENPYTVTGLMTFDRDPSAPFAVTTGSAVVPNLDADKLDGLEGSSYALTSTAAMLASANTFTVSASSGFAQTIRNTSSNAAAASSVVIGNDVDAGLGQLVSYSSNAATAGLEGASIVTLRSNAGMNIGSTGASTVGIFTNNVRRWGVNAAGDWTYGTSSHIADSSGTPTINSGFGAGSPSIAGTDYAFVVTVGTSASTGIVAFGHTWTTAPVCVASSYSTAVLSVTSTSTTTVALSLNGVFSSSDKIFVLCRGY